MKELKEQVKKLKEYHEQLKALSVVDYEEANFHQLAFPDLYMECDTEGLQEVLFTSTVHHPLYNLLFFIQTDGHIDVDWPSLGNEYMITDEEVMSFISQINEKGSKLILESTTVPTSSHTDLHDAIMGKNPESLKKAAHDQDLTVLYKKIGYLSGLSKEMAGSDADFKSMSSTCNALVLYAFRKFNIINNLGHYDYNPAVEKIDYDEAKSISKEMIEDLYINNYDNYSIIELESIGKIAKSNVVFKEYYKSIMKQSNIDMVSLVDESKGKSNTETNPNLIHGVVGLAKALGCGKNTAQKILNKNILQKEKIAYHAGKSWRINRSKLFEYLAEHPNAFKE